MQSFQTWMSAPLLLLSTGCSLLLDTEISPDVGFGEVCATSETCVSGLCEAGRCSKACSDTQPCGSTNTTCSSGVCKFLSPPPLSSLNVGLLYVGPVGDHGWTKTHDDGRRYWTQQLTEQGIAVTAAFEQSVGIPNAGNVINKFVSEGKNVIIGTSFDFLNPMLAAAPNNPDVNFLLCSGFTTTPNMGSYFGRMEAVMFQAGYLAARMTKTKRLGMVNPIAIPETVRLANAFALGVRAADPSGQTKVLMRWVEAWFNPPVETAAANELLDAGADVIMNQTDTAVPLIVANERFKARTGTAALQQIYTIGYDNPDSCNFAPDTCIASAYWNWGPMVTRILGQMHAGTWRPDDKIYEQIKSNPEESVAALIVPATQIPKFDGLNDASLEVAELLPQLTADNAEARAAPFRGPIRDNLGRERVPSSQSMSDERLLGMCWFVEGIYALDGTSPATIPSNCQGERE